MTGIDGDKLASILEEMLSKPVSNHTSPPKTTPVTREVVRRGDTLEVMVPEVLMEDSAADSLTAEGLDPALWEVTGFRRSEWGEGKVSTRFTYRRRKDSVVERQALTESELDLIQKDGAHRRRWAQPEKGRTVVVCFADFQVGKAENDTEELLARLFLAIDKACESIKVRQEVHQDVERVVAAFLGDEIEGVVSQGGSNIWRTTHTVTEQIRIVRRVMIYALTQLHQLGMPLSMVAVGGNHDIPHKIMGKGVMTFGESHDVEALLSVMDGARMSEKFADVAFHVPDTDELAVSLELSGTHVVMFHGHFARSQQRTMEWLKGQAFNRDSLYSGFHVAISGHWHGFYTETSGDRTYITAPTMEAESTWFRHATGVGGSPCLLMASVSGGRVCGLEMFRG